MYKNLIIIFYFFSTSLIYKKNYNNFEKIVLWIFVMVLVEYGYQFGTSDVDKPTIFYN